MHSLESIYNILLGRYWWVLYVRPNMAENDSCAQLFCVVGKNGHGTVVKSFSGSLDECRQFQIINGGAADGVLLVNDMTPLKIVSEEICSTNDFPGYKPENFDSVESFSGAFLVMALKNAVESLAKDVENSGFKLLLHVPAVLLYSEQIGYEDNDPHIVLSEENGYTDLWLYLEGSLAAFYRVVGNQQDRLPNYICERFVLGTIPPEKISVTKECLAKTIADDAWLFKIDNVPAFHTAVDKKAVSRINEAAIFRRTLKMCALILAVSMIVLFAFEVGYNVYKQSSETQIQSFESRMKKQKELELVWEKLERDKASSEAFLKIKTHTAGSLEIIASHVPENVWLDHWNVSKQIHSVRGYANSSEALSAFLSALENERKLINVRLRTTEETTWKNTQVVRFDLVAEAVQ